MYSSSHPQGAKITECPLRMPRIGRTQLFIILSLMISAVPAIKYEPNWNSLDSRPLPAWYDEAKVGVMVHWGVYAVPSFGGHGAIPAEWFWWYWRGDTPKKPILDFMKENYTPSFTYEDFAKMFTAELFDPDHWADIFQLSGAKYVVLTSKHHEGFTNWPSKYSWNWNSMDVGPKRDLVGDLAKSIRNKTDLHFGLYHSLKEWFHPLFEEDKRNKYETSQYAQKVAIPELYEIVNMYKPEILWSDGANEYYVKPNYWHSTGFLAWLYNDSPVKDVVVTNDRWGTNTTCKHGGFYTCGDHFNPGVLQKHKWENAMTIDKMSWGYRRDAQVTDYLDMEDLTRLLAETVSCGGNLLVNIGPTHDGRIVPIFEERLRQLGSWLKVNGEAIYASKPWRAQNDTKTQGVWYTSKKQGNSIVVYAILLDWPDNNSLLLGVPNTSSNTTVTMLGHKGALQWKPGQYERGVFVDLPSLNTSQMPCRWAWVLKLDCVS
ncbi:alpha-L-fucosidase-like isoform X2 [Asterias amurensis]